MRLNELGMVFLDQDSINSGELWGDKLKEAILAARYFVLFWCTHAHASSEVKREYIMAAAAGRQVVPVLLDDMPLPELLRPYQWIDMTAMMRLSHSAIGSEKTHQLAAALNQSDPFSPFLIEQSRIEISAVSYEGHALEARFLSALFDEEGGTIGKSSDNTLSLVFDDPDDLISRIHAKIIFRDLHWYLIQRGFHSIEINGIKLRYDDEIELHPGDEMAIGLFILRVDVGPKRQLLGKSARQFDDPFAALADTGELFGASEFDDRVAGTGELFGAGETDASNIAGSAHKETQDDETISLMASRIVDELKRRAEADEQK